MAITTTNGFVISGSTFADVVTDSNTDTTWYKIWNSDTGEFYTEGAAETSEDWVSAASLAEMDLPNEMNNFYIKSFGPNSGQSDWVDFTVSVDSEGFTENSTVDLADASFDANTTVTYDQVIDATNLSDDAWLRIWNSDESAYVDASGDGWIRGSELSSFSFTTGADGETNQIWVDQYLFNSGRSGWEDAKISFTAGETGQTFTLTDEIDSFTGGAAQDTINGIIDTTGGTSDASTWNLTDSIDGAGETDTMDVRVFNTSGTSAGLSASNVEVYNFDHVDIDTNNDETVTIDAQSFGGATQIWAKDGGSFNTGSDATTDDTIAFTSVGDGVTTGVASNGANLAVSFSYESAATGSDADAVDVAVGGGTTGSLTVADGFETVNVATQDAASVLGAFDVGSSMETLNVTGDQDLTISTAVSGFDTSATSNTIDASGNSGAVNLETSARSNLTATGGSGDSDTLTLSLANSVQSGMAVSAFETVGLYASSAATIDMDLISDATSIEVTADGTTGNALTIDDVAAGTDVTFVGDGDDDDSDTFNAMTYQLADASGDSDSLTVAVNNNGSDAGTYDATLGTITGANIESFTFSATEYDDVTVGNVNVTSANTVDINGTDDIDLGTLDTAADADVDAGDLTGEFTMTYGETTSYELTGAAGDDTIDLVNAAGIGAGEDATISTGAGDDTLTIVEDNNATGTLTVDMGAGEDTINLDVGAAGATLTNGFSLDGGDGSQDTLKIQDAGGAVTLDSFEGFEEIQMNDTGSATILTLEVANYSETMEMFDTSAQNNAIYFQADAAGTSVDISNITRTGFDGNDAFIVQTASGQETLTASDDKDAFYFDDFGGADTINDFTTGTDILVLSDTTGTNGIVSTAFSFVATNGANGSETTASVTAAFTGGTTSLTANTDFLLTANGTGVSAAQSALTAALQNLINAAADTTTVGISGGMLTIQANDTAGTSATISALSAANTNVALVRTTGANKLFAFNFGTWALQSGASASQSVSVSIATQTLFTLGANNDFAGSDIFVV